MSEINQSHLIEPQFEDGTLLFIEAQLPPIRATDNFWKHMSDWFSRAFSGSQGGIYYFDEEKNCCPKIHSWVLNQI